MPKTSGRNTSGGYSPLVVRWWPWAVLSLCLVVWVRPVLGLSGDWWWSGSMWYDLQRALGVVDAWRSGVWDARWFPSFDYGYGYPFLSFYAPLFHWLSGLWLLLVPSLTVAVRANMFSWLVLGTAGIYCAGERVWDYISEGRAGPFRPGLICAFGWLMSPYPMCNVLVRGALPEFASSQTVPWIVWAAFGILTRPSGWTRRDTGELLFLVLIVSAGVLTHNFFGMCVFGTAVGTALLVFPIRIAGRCGVTEPRAVAIRYACWGAAMGWVLLATLFFWLPIRYESQYVRVDETRQAHPYSAHFLYASNLLDVGSWRFGPSRTGPEDEMPLHLGFVSLLALCIAVFAIVFLVLSNGRRRVRLLTGIVILFAATLFSVLMTTHLTAFIWDRIVLLQFAQFPWRLLSIPTVGICLLLPAGLVAAEPSPVRPSFIGILAVLIICFVGSHYAYGRILRRIPCGDPVNPHKWEQMPIRTANIDEYGPIWRDSNREPKWLPGALYPNDQVEVRSWNYQGIAVRASIHNKSDAPQPVVIAWNYFPGWQGCFEPEGAPLTLSPEAGSGLIQIAGIPSGDSEIHVWFGDTPIRRRCKIVSGLAWLAWLGAWIALAATALRVKQSTKPSEPS